MGIRHDGRYIAYNDYADPTTETNADEWLLPAQKGAQPIPLMKAKFNEQRVQFSPNDRRIAYESDETGRWEVYIRSFSVSPGGAPVLGAAYQVSKAGGQLPLWTKGGKELVFVGPRARLTAVSVTESPRFETGPLQELFEIQTSTLRDFAIQPDGQRVLAVAASSENASWINVVTNWPSLLGSSR